MSIDKLLEYLDDFGCNETVKDAIVKCHKNQDTTGIIKLLRKHRQTILNTIHNQEKQISCLDYFVFQLEEEINTQK